MTKGIFNFKKLFSKKDTEEILPVKESEDNLISSAAQLLGLSEEEIKERKEMEILLKDFIRRSKSKEGSSSSSPISSSS